MHDIVSHGTPSRIEGDGMTIPTLTDRWGDDEARQAALLAEQTAHDRARITGRQRLDALAATDPEQRLRRLETDNEVLRQLVRALNQDLAAVKAAVRRHPPNAPLPLSPGGTARPTLPPSRPRLPSPRLTVTVLYALLAAGAGLAVLVMLAGGWPA